MKKKSILLVSIVGILLMASLFSSCGATYTASGTNVSKIDELALIEPMSIMIYYDKPNSGYRDPSLASTSEQLLTDLLTTTRYPFTDPVPADYEGEGTPIAKWIGTFPDLESSDIKLLEFQKHLPS